MGNKELQEEFGKYIRSLSDKDTCRYMIGIELPMCSYLDVDCQYRGEDTYSLRAGIRKECRRPRVMKFKKILGK